MTQEEIIKKAYEVYPDPDVKRGSSVFANDVWTGVEKLREAYIKGLTEQIGTSLPSNLDEAVKEAMPESYGFLEVDIYGGSESVYSREQMRDIFLAGAEWMAEQYELVHDENCAVPDERGGYWPTQIKLYRKKEE